MTKMTKMTKTQQDQFGRLDLSKSRRIPNEAFIEETINSKTIRYCIIPGFYLAQDVDFPESIYLFNNLKELETYFETVNE